MIINDAYTVLGITFLLLIGISYFFPVFEVVVKSREYVLAFFVSLVVGKYMLYKHREKE